MSDYSYSSSNIDSQQLTIELQSWQSLIFALLKRYLTVPNVYSSDTKKCRFGEIVFCAISGTEQLKGEMITINK